MNKSDIIRQMGYRLPDLNIVDIDKAVDLLLDMMGQHLAAGNRCELRGFGSFSMHTRAAQMGRNPRTGEQIALSARRIIHFRPGKDVRERVNLARANAPIQD